MSLSKVLSTPWFIRRGKLNDPRALRAVAHPLRLGIVEQLVAHGAMTATELAGRLEETPSNCSWHLRKPAEYGFVEEAEGGTGRGRLWQAASRGMRWGDPDESQRWHEPATR